MKKAITEIRGEDSAELKAKLNDLRKEQFNLRFRGSQESGAKTTRSREVRRSIARIMMVLGDRARTGDDKPTAAGTADAKSPETKATASATKSASPKAATKAADTKAAKKADAKKPGAKKQ
jgi:large subunit ribosomal protein L29